MYIMNNVKSLNNSDEMVTFWIQPQIKTLYDDFMQNLLNIISIDEVYIDGPFGSKTLASVLLARFERVSHMTHFYK